jgi:hypothetical protein
LPKISRVSVTDDDESVGSNMILQVSQLELFLTESARVVEFTGRSNLAVTGGTYGAGAGAGAGCEGLFPIVSIL